LKGGKTKMGTNETKLSAMEEIHMSLVNGQRRQMVEQIDEYGVYDFWADYNKYLSESYYVDEKFDYFADAVISYHHIKNR